MIDISKLTESDKGRRVVYSHRFGDLTTMGILWNWDKRFIEVELDASDGGTLVRHLDPSSLKFAEDVK